MTPLTIGDRLISLELLDLNEQIHDLKEYLGNHLLISFWSMRCFSCMKAAKDLKVLHETLSDKLTIVGINMDTQKGLWEQGTSRDAIAWPNLSDLKGFSDGAGKEFGITGYPAYVLVNVEGIIVDRWMGYKPGRIEEKVKAQLNNPT